MSVAVLEAAGTSRHSVAIREAELVTANRGLVHVVARRYRGRGLEDEDLVQEGTIGLLAAARRFDSARGCQFSTVACWWIRAAVVRAVRDRGRLVRVPANVHDDVVAWERAERRLAEDLGRRPTLEELELATGIAAAIATAGTRASRPHVSLAAPAPRGERALEELLAAREDDAGAGEREELRELLARALAELEPRARVLLELRFGLTGPPRTLPEVGRALGITKQGALKAERRALEALRRSVARASRPLP